MPLYALARIELPQLIWGTMCKGVSRDPPSVGDQVPRHRVTLRTAEQHEPKQAQQVRLEEPVECLLLGVIC
jgi:hypothetical protein